MVKKINSNDKTSLISDSAFIPYVSGASKKNPQSALLVSHQQEVKKRLVEFCHKYDIKKMSLFGSFAKGTAKKKSDIDILIEFYKSKEKSLLKLAQMENELEEIYGRKVDLVTLNSLHNLLKNEVMATSRVIYEK